MTITQGRQAQALIGIINNYEIETQEQLLEIFEIETKNITDKVVLNAIKSELGIN
jgi:hypothetical protein